LPAKAGEGVFFLRVGKNDKKSTARGRVRKGGGRQRRGGGKRLFLLGGGRKKSNTEKNQNSIKWQNTNQPANGKQHRKRKKPT